MNDRVKISAHAFLDYVSSTPQGCVSIVKMQRAMYLDPGSQAYFFYKPILNGLKRAVSSTDADSELEKVVASAGARQKLHFEEINDGFLAWWTRVRATGVACQEATWTQENLSVKLHSLIGLRLNDGSKIALLPYVKAPKLTTGAANMVLRILECEIDAVLPDAKPMVLDTRRGVTFKLRANTNRRDLDALLAAEAAKYVTHWKAAA